MIGRELSILLLSFLITSGFAVLPTVRNWWKDLFARAVPSILVISTIMVTFLGGKREGEDAGVFLDDIRMVRVGLLILLFLWSSFGIFFNKRSLNSISFSLKCFFLYCFVALVSFSYSPMPFLTLWKSFEVMVIVVCSLYTSYMIKNENDIIWLLNIISLSLFYLIISVFVGYILYPNIAFDNITSSGSMAFAVSGIAPKINSNTVSQLSSILFLINLAYLSCCKKTIFLYSDKIIIMLISVFVMIIGHARTSIIACIVASSFALIKCKKFLWLVICFYVIILSYPLYDYFLEYIYRGQQFKQFVGMSGRMFFWDTLSPTIYDNFLLGHGFYAGHRLLLGVSSVDNTYIEVMFDLGFVGLFIFILALFGVFVNFFRLNKLANANNSLKLIYLQFFVVFIVLFIRSLTGPSFHIFHPSLPIYLYILISVNSLCDLYSQKA